jgi:DNA replication protein DnaC
MNPPATPPAQPGTVLGVSGLHQLTPHLKRLRLSGILDSLEVRTQQAIAEQWSYSEFLTRLVQDEVERRAHKQLDRRLRRSQVNSTKTLETFDFTFNRSINRQQVFDLATCAFVRQRRNVLIVGQTGVGKTHLAHALAHEAARQGFDILCTTAHRMLAHIHAGRADGTADKRLQTYLRPQVLVVDDFGLKPLPTPSGAADFYDVINERYEHASMVLTSNRAPDEWHELFGDPLLASAGLDRLAHGATVVTITGRSYRLATPATTAGGPAAPSSAPPTGAPGTRGATGATGATG